MNPTYKIFKGDAAQILEKLSKKRSEVQKYRTVVTSPPYYKHRNYGTEENEIGQEDTPDKYIDRLMPVFEQCKNLLTDDGSLFIVIGDTRRNHHKLMIPHRLAMRLSDIGYVFREDIIWYKKNAVSSSSKSSLTQAYEFVLFLSKSKKTFMDIDSIRVRGNETLNKTQPDTNQLQLRPFAKDTEAIQRISEIIHNSKPETPFEDLPGTDEIARAYGYDPEKKCPTCYRKFKRHATRKRFGDHKHYPIFAACNPQGKNPGNVWEISTKAHHGNEHFAMFPEDLISRIVKLATKQGDYVLDPFAGRGTTGIVSACLGRNFTGIDLYGENIAKIERNVKDAVNMNIPAKVLRQIIETPGILAR